MDLSARGMRCSLPTHAAKHCPSGVWQPAQHYSVQPMAGWQTASSDAARVAVQEASWPRRVLLRWRSTCCAVECWRRDSGSRYAAGIGGGRCTRNEGPTTPAHTTLGQAVSSTSLPLCWWQSRVYRNSTTDGESGNGRHKRRTGWCGRRGECLGCV